MTNFNERTLCSITLVKFLRVVSCRGKTLSTISLSNGRNNFVASWSMTRVTRSSKEARRGRRGPSIVDTCDPKMSRNDYTRHLVIVFCNTIAGYIGLGEYETRRDNRLHVPRKDLSSSSSWALSRGLLLNLISPHIASNNCGIITRTITVSAASLDFRKERYYGTPNTDYHRDALSMLKRVVFRTRLRQRADPADFEGTTNELC